MLKPLRSRPDEPPSSVTVTSAARSVMRQGSHPSPGIWPGEATCLRRPRSSVDRPVPPPMATTRRGTGGALSEEVLKWPSFELGRVGAGRFSDESVANWSKFVWRKAVENKFIAEESIGLYGSAGYGASG